MAGEQVVVDGKIVDAPDTPPDDTNIENGEIIDDASVSGADDGVGADGEGDDEGDKPKELWMSDDDQQSDGVPVATHIRTKRKLKGKLSDRDAEIERLKQENSTLKAGVNIAPAPAATELPRRPRENDFETLDAYDMAMTEYEGKMIETRLNLAGQKTDIQRRQAAAQRKVEENVDGHYERAAKLVDENGIDTEVYRATDETFRQAVDTIKPGQGDAITDHLISTIGEGSEKVIYFMGRNKIALETFKSLLAEDSSGLKASVFLGQQKERLAKSKRQTSNARAPGATVKGDAGPASSAQGNALLKKRKAAQAKGNVQEAYNIKKQAKAAGVDVSTW